MLDHCQHVVLIWSCTCRGRLIDDVDCFELLEALCNELHEEFMALQEAVPALDEVLFLSPNLLQ